MLSKTDYHPIEIEPVWVHCKCTIQMALRLTGLQEIESICGMKIRFDHGWLLLSTIREMISQNLTSYSVWSESWTVQCLYVIIPWISSCEGQGCFHFAKSTSTGKCESLWYTIEQGRACSMGTLRPTGQCALCVIPGLGMQAEFNKTKIWMRHSKT